MSDPRHPAKVVIVIEQGMVQKIITDKAVGAKFYIADYDVDKWDGVDEDKQGVRRCLIEEPAFIDGMGVRVVINKKGRRGDD